MIVDIKDFEKDTVSSVESIPPPKKSSPMINESEVSLSSKGGKPQVLTYPSITL